IGTPFPSDTIMTLVPLPTLVFPIPFPLFWREQIDHPEKLGTIRFSLPHPFDSTVHAKSAPTSRLPTIASIAANRWWENHIAGACPPKYNRFSRLREFRSGFFADLRADVRVPVLVWEEEVQSQPIVRLSAHVSYSYFHFTLADHVFEIACRVSYKRQLARLVRICMDFNLVRKKNSSLMGKNMLLGFRLRLIQMECVIGELVNFIRKSMNSMIDMIRRDSDVSRANVDLLYCN